MINSKYLNKIVCIFIFIALITCALMVYYAQVNPTTKKMQYESKLFGDEILIIDIQVDNKDWQELLDNPTAKEYIPADLTINGETFSSVGLRAKGNSSLTQVAQMRDSDRYSLHFKFNKYQKGRTYYGLDTFCINNIIGDNTYMKDYLSYDIMNYIGVPSPLMNYAKVTVNGEYFGFYIILERYEKSFLDRIYDTSGGQLYNVKIQMGQREDFIGRIEWQKEDISPKFEGGVIERPDNNFEFPLGDLGAGNNFEFPPRDLETDNTMQNNQNAFRNESRPSRDKKEGSSQDDSNVNLTELNKAPLGEQNKGAERFPQDINGRFPGNMGGRSGGHGGGDLIYTDNSISSYSSIFDNAEFKKNTDKDKQRVITALRNLNEGTDLEKYFDVDEILRYLAAHTVVVNLDSYSSSMAQNYYIYEHEGKISILPWDYNLAFGGFQGGNVISTINFPIDTPVSGVSMEDRPLINKFLEVPEYKERYHEYLAQIVEGYFKGGIFEETISALDNKISDYVKNDTTSFTTYEKYTASLPILKELGLLRAKSIEGQLNGTIPSTTEGQNANKDSLISGDGINLSDLGSFMNGGGNPNIGEQGIQAQPGIRGGQEGANRFGNPVEMPDMSKMSEAIIIVLQESGGQISSEIREKLLALGLKDEEINQLEEIFSNLPKNSFENWDNRNSPRQDVPDRQGRAKDSLGMVTAANSANKGYTVVIGILIIILIATTYLLSKYKRRY